MDVNHNRRIATYSSLLSQYPHFRFLDTHLSPSSKDGVRKINYKRFMLMLLTAKSSKTVEEIQAENYRNKQNYYLWSDAIQYSIPYDANRSSPVRPNIRSVYFLPDTQKYRTVNKNVILRDSSNLAVLKILLYQHQISRVKYKESIHRIKDGKRPRTNVQERIQLYLSTVKTSTSKTTLTGLKRKADRRYFQSVKLGNQSYSVTLKRSCFRNRNLQTFKRTITNERIQEEAINRMKNSNRLDFQAQRQA